MRISIPPGVVSDTPWVSPPGIMRAVRGLNIRWRLGLPETLGLFGPLRNLAGEAVVVPRNNTETPRAVYTAQFGEGVQIVVAAANRVDLVTVDPATPPDSETRYRVETIDATLTPAVSETLPNPTLKAIVIPPTWWFVEQEGVIVGQRAGVDESVRAWSRAVPGGFNPLRDYDVGDDGGSPSLDAPKRAVAGGLLNRILVLLGCESFDPSTPRDMVVRWSNRGNFELWNPLIVIDPLTTTANISGEFLLDIGNRIVGGGTTAFGIVVWTDKAMALVNETGDFNTILGRRYIDGARGMLSNRAWCEADGRLWWIDGGRTLNMFDGGRPVEIENPLRRGTIDRVNEVGAPRIYMAANAEYGEVLIWYPSGDSTECDRALVYNYREQAWSIWGLSRAHWYPRQGIQEAVAVGLDGTVYAQDIGPACPTAYRPDAILPIGPGTGCGAGTAVGASNLTPINAFFEIGPMVADEAAQTTFSGVRTLMSWLPTPAVGAEQDEVRVTLTGYEDASVRDRSHQEVQMWTQSDTVREYRVSGRSLSVRFEFENTRTVWRLGYMDLALGGSDGGER